jgi:hypothetical protein
MAYKTHEELYKIFELDNSNFFKVEKYSPKETPVTSDSIPRKRKANLANLVDLVDLGELPLKKRLRPTTLKPKPKIYTYTPGKEILNSLSPISKLRMIQSFREDDKKIDNKDKEQERLDKEYTYFEPTEVGIHMELWVCSQMKCPGCKGDLLKYQSVSQPVVDVKCSNHLHNIFEHGPKYYQIKATEKGTNMNGKKYFSLRDKYIKVGSRKFGQNAHEIKVSDDEQKKRVLIGYICIEYTKNEGSREITIDGNTSFILIPNLSYQLKVGDIDKLYYEYIQQDKFPTVQFNLDFFTIIRFRELATQNLILIVNLDDKYDLFDPLQKKDLFESIAKKYLKYKMKYLELKNKLNS